MLAATAIVLVVVVAAALLWWRSDARATTSMVAEEPAAALVAATRVPPTLSESWQAPSAATTAPVVAGGVVATADGSEVAGRTPSTGQTRWSYTRANSTLCAAAGQWSLVVAVYRTNRGCSDVTALQASTGARGAQRTSLADDQVTLLGDGVYLASIGSTRTEVWRSDLVRTMELGRVDAPVNPGSQPREGCAIRSVASSTSRVAVVFSCPGEAGERLSLFGPTPDDATKPAELATTLLGVDGARAVAEAGDRTVVYLPGEQPVLTVYDSGARPVSTVPVAAADAPPPRTGSAEGARLVEPTTTLGSTLLWWTGRATVALGTGDYSTAWAQPGALGPGVEMATQLLLPVPEGIAVLSPATGLRMRTIDVPRPAGSVPPGQALELAVAGTVVLEQRGATVVALS